MIFLRPFRKQTRDRNLKLNVCNKHDIYCFSRTAQRISFKFGFRSLYKNCQTNLFLVHISIHFHGIQKDFINF
jgi:hypothetical protein